MARHRQMDATDRDGLERLASRQKSFDLGYQAAQALSAERIKVLEECLNGIVRGAEAVLIESGLNETDVDRGVLQLIRDDAKAALENNP